MSWQEIVFLVIIFLANIIQAITGFAGTVLAMPPSLRLVGADVAKPVLNIAAIVICLYVVIKNWKDIQWKDFLIITLCVGVGFAAGFGVELLPINGDILLRVYGAIIAIIAVIYFFVPLEKIKIPTWVLVILLIFGGVLHKLYVSGGPLVVIYAMKRFKDKNQFRATLSLMWIVLNGIMFGQHVYQGLFTPHIWILVAIAFGVSILSYIIGYFAAKKLPLSVFMKVTYVLLFVSGISLIV